VADALRFPKVVAGLRSLRPALVDALIVLDRTTSTNDYGRQLVELTSAGTLPDATLVVAQEQTGGRGREGRSWVSPPGAGLYASLLIEVPDRDLVQNLPLAVGVGLCVALRDLGARECALKWPNDLVVEGRKLGGMLIEVVTSGEAPPVAIIGFGINLAGEHETLKGLGATSLEALIEEPPDLVELTAAVVRSLLGALNRMDDTAKLVDEYSALVAHQEGDELTWQQNGSRVRGRYAGVDERGFLRLDTDQGTVVVAAGEVIAQ
jgi:BirA family biotin operon repressor/biotin-[acetyl-CoA-carboxylase] ligase